MVELPDELTLVTGDVRLRRLRAGDADAIARMRNDADVARWSQPGGCTPEDAARAVAEAADAWRDGTRAELAIAAREDDTFVGSVSLTFYGPARAGIGFDVAPEARGRGLATRAVVAASAWAFGAFPELVRLELWALPGNAPSMKVAERSGFRREGVFRSRLPFAGELRDVVVFSRLRDDPAPD